MAEANASSFEKYLTPLAVLLGAIVIAAAFAFGSGDRNQGSGAAPAEVDINTVKTDTSPSIGDRSAPVTIAVWYDFQCRYCHQYETTTLQEVKRTYIDSGKVRIVFKDFQFLGPASFETARYSRAVWEAAPSAWGAWYADVVAGSQGESTLTNEGLDALARTHGIDVAQIDALVAEKGDEYDAAIDADRAEGQQFGITGTPSTIIGSTLVGGAQPFSAIAPLIDAELGS